MLFLREDWSLFRNLGTLSQKAGVPLKKLRMLVLKELADNALDVSGEVILDKRGEFYTVEDKGSGIDGGSAEIAELFSIKRPLTSSKILRLPSRGALGNGLRVVVGSVLASGGQMSVVTRGVGYHLEPQDDGTTRVIGTTEVPGVTGTRVSIRFGDSLPSSGDDLAWARLAQIFKFAKTYKGKSSPWWYDSDSFFELLLAAGELETVTLVEMFDKGETKSIRIGENFPAQCNRFVRDKADELLTVLRESTPEILPSKIGKVGGQKGDSYHKVEGVLTIQPGRGKLEAKLPYVVEAWATPAKEGEDDRLQAYVNGTPITGEMRTERQKGNKLAVFGCGLRHYVNGASRKKGVYLLNVVTPHMPITTDGKEPDFSRYLGAIEKAVAGAVRKLKTNIRKSSGFVSQKDIILGNLRQGIDLASGGGDYRYSIRQLYYAIRPHVLAEAEGGELDYNYFCSVVGQYEADMGELKGLYRDPRGNLYHPHSRQTIPIGTIAVENYQRPAWSFNKILYIEKEGFVNLLTSVGWPEEHDCALLSSKGFASRAVRDLLDLLGETDEEIHFYCVHDADASGTLIYQALQSGTSARDARRVKIHNLGLEPWEAMDMGLQVEEFTTKGGRGLPVAEYVESWREERPPRDSDCYSWKEWLQGRRIELNAMTSPQFIDWLNGKMVERGATKLVPPTRVLQKALVERTEAALRQRLTDRILNEQGFEEAVLREMEARKERLDQANVESYVRADLVNQPKSQWTEPVANLAEKLAD